MRYRRSAFVLLTFAAFARPALATDGDPVVVVQETRTPAAAQKKPGAHHAPSVQHIALLRNSGPRPVRVVRVTVEFYDFFGKILWAKSAVPVPSRMEPGGTATLSLSTPALEAARRTRYRMEYGGDHAARPRPH
jgi:hypothetical protein